MNTRTKWVVAGATSVLGLGTVFGAVGAANALDLDRNDDIQPVTGIVVGDPQSVIPGSAVTPSPEPAIVQPAAPVAPAVPVAPSNSVSAPSAVSAASAPSAVSAASAPSAVSAVSADSDD